MRAVAHDLRLRALNIDDRVPHAEADGATRILVFLHSTGKRTALLLAEGRMTYDSVS